MTKKALILAALAIAASAYAAGRKSTIQMIYQPLDNGDFRLSLYGSDRALVCEEKDIKIISQGDAISPVVIECRH